MTTTLWGLFTWRMTIPGHFLLGGMFTPGTFPFEDDNDPLELFTRMMITLGTFYLNFNDSMTLFTRRRLPLGTF
jgi:hypothetical protein